ncbi:SIR2 family protein [Methylobacterium sp. EM32]|uniref:SIR2 family protein n=1 Tax=Methylobacterium sp. EM32 TaxID=3163481 RepID=UPI0033BE1E4D
MSVDDIRQSATEKKLVVVFGAGASMALTPKSKNALSWTGLVRSALDYGKMRSFIKESQYDRYLDALQSGDVDELLGVAEFIGRKLEAPHGDSYARWMQNTFERWAPEPGGMQNALRTIEDQQIPIATLNYDTLIELATGLQPIDFADTPQLMRWLRKEHKGVLHLHGIWMNPKNCVFGIRDYENAIASETREIVQRSLGSLNRLLFVGCGDTFSDPNFTAWIKWLRKNIGASYPQHYALVKDDEVSQKFADPTWHGFVDPIGFGANYSDLPGFLLDCFPTRRSAKTPASKSKAAAVQSNQVIDAYRNFLMRDCGQMAIEGMPGDMDAGQRKFDIEKLFVPLEMIGINPANTERDTDGDIFAQEWRNTYQDPIDFATVFEREQRIALLALPGGGKTLLLKRLAVAYANPSRRASSSDKLPALALIPIMIRCREWKEYIHQPVMTLLKNISSITGDGSLNNLSDAIEKYLKSGSVLLLIDGLDEIHSDGDRTVFVENLEKFLEQYPKIRIIVTSREAGFELIAPVLSRFCSKFRIAPLNSEAIQTLCEHWHKLMSGGTPDAMAEAAEVADTLLNSASLSMLAGNPLLCTMLLVVKHGFGRLPSDRVTLYDRAVELLLDTWNIKGHKALNIKEAVPQLACVALELLKRGKQTATERELLEILDAARSQLPMIGRYAKDSSHEFIKRVELRSSLMLQGGFRKEDGRVVPFYQFRHLTFQEYLSAVAVVDGHIINSKKPHSILGAIGDNILSDEWKEVIPMAARLGRSQSPPLLDALVAHAEKEMVDFVVDQERRLEFSSETHLPPATARILRSMIEEANLSPENLSRAAPIVACFANGCNTPENWQALSQGPYGPDLREAALDIFLKQPYWNRCHSRNTVALLEAMSKPGSYWKGNDCVEDLMKKLTSTDERDIVRHTLSICGCIWQFRDESSLTSSIELYNVIESLLYNQTVKVQFCAAWAWGFWRLVKTENGDPVPTPDRGVIGSLINIFLNQIPEISEIGRFAVPDLNGLPRGYCDIDLQSDKRALLRGWLSNPPNRIDHDQSELALSVARASFIIKDFASNAEIIDYIRASALSPSHVERMREILRMLGEPDLLGERRQPAQSRRTQRRKVARNN